MWNTQHDATEWITRKPIYFINRTQTIFSIRQKVWAMFLWYMHRNGIPIACTCIFNATPPAQLDLVISYPKKISITYLAVYLLHSAPIYRNEIKPNALRCDCVFNQLICCCCCCCMTKNRFRPNRIRICKCFRFANIFAKKNADCSFALINDQHFKQTNALKQCKVACDCSQNIF